MRDAFDALDRLIEQDIFLLDRMWELRLRSSQIGLLTNRLTRAIDRTEVADIASDFEEPPAGGAPPGGQHRRSGPARAGRQSISAALRGGIRQLAVSSSLFGDRVRLLAIGEELASVSQRNGGLASALNGVARRT